MVDYKNSRRRAKKKKDPTPGWVWMIFGLAVGLSVALAVYIADRRPVVHKSEAKPVPSSIREEEEPEEEAPGRGFDFFTMLPEMEVVIPEAEVPSSSGKRIADVEDPGKYELQAGSFQVFGDADRRKANLALLGIESRIENVTIDHRRWHRVRIGPITDLASLNRVRAQLGGEGIDYMLIKLKPKHE